MKKSRKAAKAGELPASEEMKAEYDFSGAIRGKYAAQYREGTNVAFLAPDVAEAFRTSQAVNRALRAVLRQRKSKGQT